jgi:hypothetical protein
LGSQPGASSRGEAVHSEPKKTRVSCGTTRGFVGFRRKSDPDGTRTRVAAVKGREYPLENANTATTYDDSQTRCPQRCPQETENDNADRSPTGSTPTAETLPKKQSEGAGWTPSCSPAAKDGTGAETSDGTPPGDRPAAGITAAETLTADPLAGLAAAIGKLAPGDRERLAALLTAGHTPENRT